jgi:Na+/H+ antiporter NhaD/arsenite permease-like protein
MAEHFWHSTATRPSSPPCSRAVAGYLVYLWQTTGQEGYVHLLGHQTEEYIAFIVLLFALYTVSGGIAPVGDIEGRPLTNAFILARWVPCSPTSWAPQRSMLLIRPFLRINSERKNTRHLPIFFIFMVSNVGGLLTPLGDPPLFLGFLRGVDFFWTTLNLWPHWLLVNGVLLAIFFAWDTMAYQAETERAIRRDVATIHPLRLRGLFNFLLIAFVVAAVLVHSAQVAGAWRLRFPFGEFVLLGIALASWLVTPKSVREANRFTWHPIIEVAVLFASIFITMGPALELLRTQHFELEPWAYFWMTGALSSFLDNAPTYVAFGTMAAHSPDFSKLMTEKPQILAAISCGAVFMGATPHRQRQLHGERLRMGRVTKRRRSLATWRTRAASANLCPSHGGVLLAADNCSLNGYSGFCASPWARSVSRRRAHPARVDRQRSLVDLQRARRASSSYPTRLVPRPRVVGVSSTFTCDRPALAAGCRRCRSQQVSAGGDDRAGSRAATLTIYRFPTSSLTHHRARQPYRHSDILGDRVNYRATFSVSHIARRQTIALTGGWRLPAGASAWKCSQAAVAAFVQRPRGCTLDASCTAEAPASGIARPTRTPPHLRARPQNPALREDRRSFRGKPDTADASYRSHLPHRQRNQALRNQQRWVALCGWSRLAAGRGELLRDGTQRHRLRRRSAAVRATAGDEIAATPRGFGRRSAPQAADR